MGGCATSAVLPFVMGGSLYPRQHQQFWSTQPIESVSLLQTEMTSRRPTSFGSELRLSVLAMAREREVGQERRGGAKGKFGQNSGPNHSVQDHRGLGTCRGDGQLRWGHSSSGNAQ